MVKKIRNPKVHSKTGVDIAERHITRRIGAHQRATQKRKEARKKARR